MPDDRQFAEQGGAATMDPSFALRWVSSKFMQRMGDVTRLERRRARMEKRRLKQGSAHVVEYFHQTDDGYSHLAVQLLQPLLDRYDIDLVCHLIEGPEGRNAPEPELLLDLSMIDSAAIAPHYGCEFPADARRPDDQEIELANRGLAGLTAVEFARQAPGISQALWSGSARVSELPLALVESGVVEEKLAEGKARRERLKHYSGGMFYYAGEWYWGVDRIYHLEQRLISLGAGGGHGKEGLELLYPRPDIEFGPGKDTGKLTLEFYPSLRSPYTSVIFDKTIDLAEATGINLRVCPVLPMVMRGVPATREKGQYIFTDAAREARTLGLKWGNAYDPIGEPVRRCYSLYSWARSEERGCELLAAFLEAAFFQCINTNNDRGMRKVVEAAGLDWARAQSIIGNADWHDEIEANRQAMYEAGLWGVPSYRLIGAEGQVVLALWGQDRLWLVSREIQRLLEDA